MESYQPGQALDVAALLKEGETVDVAGVTVGKGFQGRQLGGRHEGEATALPWVRRAGRCSRAHGAGPTRKSVLCYPADVRVHGGGQSRGSGSTRQQELQQVAIWVPLATEQKQGWRRGLAWGPARGRAVSSKAMGPFRKRQHWQRPSEGFASVPGSLYIVCSGEPYRPERWCRTAALCPADPHPAERIRA